MKNYIINSIMNDINDKRPYPLHKQIWYRTVWLKMEITIDFNVNLGDICGVNTHQSAGEYH